MARTRTMIYLQDEHRARLAEAAAKRVARKGGRRDISSIIADALDVYFEKGGDDEASIKRLLALGDSISKAEGDRMRANVRKARQGWRQ